MSLFQSAAGHRYTSARDFHPTAGNYLVYSPRHHSRGLKPCICGVLARIWALRGIYHSLEQPKGLLRSGLERRPHLDGTDAAVRWNPLRRRLEASSAAYWQELRSGLETLPQWAGNFCHLTPAILGIWPLP